jgi:8-oxo-dGTP pyrophosphatase MutT (NUDIX family)
MRSDLEAPLIATIYRHEGLDLFASRLYRLAVRALVIQEGKYLLIRSKKFGECKFPGGGVDDTETMPQALARELAEETGYPLAGVAVLYGKTIEYARDFEGKYAIFHHESLYYRCNIGEIAGILHLDAYERDYGYQPLWLSLAEAIAINDSIPHNDRIPWKERDTFVMKRLLKEEQCHAD